MAGRKLFSQKDQKFSDQISSHPMEEAEALEQKLFQQQKNEALKIL